MSNEKFSQMPAATTLGSTDYFPIVQGGINKTVTSAIISSLTISPKNVVYVAKNGSDANDGSFGHPFLTVAAAYNSITGQNANNQFLVWVGPGFYTEASLSFKSNIFIDGAGPFITILDIPSPNFVPDATFLFTYEARFYMSNLTLNDDFTWDFTTGTGGGTPKIVLNNVSMVNVTLLNTTVGYVPHIQFNNSELSGILDGEAQCEFSSTNTTYSQSINASNSVGNGVYLFNNCNALYFTLSNNGIVQANNTNNVGPYQLDGTNCRVICDQDSYTGISLTSGAIKDQLVIVPNLLFSPSNIRYVDPNGSDVSGDGTFNNPYATASHAMLQITTASPSNIFAINLCAGTHTDFTIAWKPYVYMIGQSQEATVYNLSAFTFDSTYLATVVPTSGVQALQFENDLTFDFSGSTGPGHPRFTLRDVAFQTITELNSSSSPRGSMRFYNCSGQYLIVSGEVDNIIENTDFNRDITIANPLTSLTNSHLRNVNCDNLITSDHATVTIYTSAINQIHIDGTNVVIQSDVVSYDQPVVTGGASSSQLGPFSLGQGVFANTTPAHYTPTDGSVSGNLEGIDAELGILLPIDPLNIVYVSTTGSDTPMTGRGSIQFPYLTIGASIASITTQSATNLWVVQFSPGVYIEDVAVKPYIYLRGQSQLGCIIKGNITLDPLFLASGSDYAGGIFNFTVQLKSGGTGITFDFTSANLTNSSFYINKIITNPNQFSPIQDIPVTVHGSSFNNVLLFHYDNSWTNGGFSTAITFTGVYPVYSQGNTYNTVSLVVNDDTTNPVGPIIYMQDENFDFLSRFTVDGDISVGGTLVILNNCPLNVSGVNPSFSNASTIFTDVSSYKAWTTTAGSPTLALRTISDGLDANFSPSHYTPVDTSVNGNLRGIDAKFGDIGTVISSRIAPAGVSLTSNTETNLTSINLLANATYILQGNVNFITSSAAVTSYQAGGNSTSATLPDAASTVEIHGTNIGNWGASIPSSPIAVGGSNLTLYIVAKAIFTGGATTVCGGFYATRIK